MLRFRAPTPPVRLSAAEPQESLRRIADRLEPGLRDAFLMAARALGQDVALSRLAAILERGDTEAALGLVPWEQFEVDLTNGYLDMAQPAIEQSGTTTLDLLAQQLEVEPSLIQWNATNPEAERWVRDHGAELVKEVSQETRKAVHDTIERAFMTGGTPRQQASVIKTQIGLTSKGAAAVEHYKQGLTALGKSQGEIEKLIGAYAQRLLKQRAMNIARTETIRALSQGQQAVWNQAADQGLLIKDRTIRVWSAAPDERTCPICGALHGKEAPLDGLFPGGHDRPPAHPSCRCAVRLRFEGGVRPPVQSDLVPAGQPTPVKEGLSQYVRKKWTVEEALQAEAEAPAFFQRAAPNRVSASVLKQQTASRLANRLKEDPDYLRLLEEVSEHHLATGSSVEKKTATLIEQWAKTAADRNPLSVAMQRAAAIEFNLTVRTSHLRNTEEIEKTIERYEPGLRKFLRAQYEDTQAFLRERQVTEVIVYRGVRAKAALKVPSTGIIDAEVDLQPLSSFTTRASVALGFAGSKGAVMALKVPSDRIFSSVFTGMGCQEEFEFLLLGDLSVPVKGLSTQQLVGGSTMQIVKDPLTGVKEMKLVKVVPKEGEILMTQVAEAIARSM